MGTRKVYTSVNSPPPCDESQDGSSGPTASTSAEIAVKSSRYGSVEPTKDDSIQDGQPITRKRLSILRKIAYGCGHVFNDLCASMWFTYLLLFFHMVLRINNTYAGIILLIGQVADAAATPVIGFLCDKTRSRYGRRKTWHLAGTVMVAVSLFFFWHTCLFCTDMNSPMSNITNSSHSVKLGGDGDHDSDDGTPIQLRVLYFAVPIIIFQFGWAAVQISHLSLIPELTEDANERVGLNAIRYSATIMSNLSVFAVMFVLLETVGHNTADDGRIVPGDLWIFSGTALGIIGAGCFFSGIFHVGTREPSSSSEQKKELADGRRLVWYKWFLKPQFYAVAIIYMCTRLVVNLTQVYTPLYLVDSLKLNKNSVAIGPLVIYISGFIMTFILKIINKLIGRYMAYFIGIALVWGGLVWIWVQSPPEGNVVAEVFLYGSTVLIGAGGATILVTSLSMVADLIGCAVGSGAFVYGLMSFTDKISNGVAVLVIQALHPCNGEDQVCCPACALYYRHVLSFVPGGASLLACGALGVLSIIIFRKQRRCKDVSPICPRRAKSLPATAKGDMVSSEGSIEESLEKKPLIGQRR